MGTRPPPCHCELSQTDHRPAQPLSPLPPGLETQASSLTPCSTHSHTRSCPSIPKCVHFPPTPLPPFYSKPPLSLSWAVAIASFLVSLLPVSPLATTKMILLKHKSHLIAPLLTTLQNLLIALGRKSKILTWVDSVLTIYSLPLASSLELSVFILSDSLSPLGVSMCYSLCLKHLCPSSSLIGFIQWVPTKCQECVRRCPHNV